MAMFLVTIGIVYGDIGTSPLYVMKSIIEGNGGLAEINQEFIIGSLSLIIWTITLLTTIKYVIIAMKADNHGEGGIFSLYTLVKDCGKWLIIPAMIGGSALLADGVLTPAVTVTTAVEGLRSIETINRILGEGQKKIIIIVLIIIGILFAIQRAGTSKIGKTFGPVMFIWFSFLAATGAVNIVRLPAVLLAFNPVYAVKLLLSPYNKLGFMILGSVFLAATGAEALYSDMGHVGRENIYFSWPFVKICLITNYLGQGAWVISSRNDAALRAITDMNPFFMMLPEALRPVAILLGAAAAVIASQALITGSYTLVSEAIHIDLMPHLEVKHPSETKGQIFIATVNTILWIGCSAVVLYFRSGSRIESAYGLAITLTMLMTTLLLAVYLWKIKNKLYVAIPMLLVFGSIESVFFISSLSKFAIGGYVTVIIALLLFSVMIIWYRGTEIEKESKTTVNFPKYIDKLRALRDDDSIPYTAGNLVYLENNLDGDSIDKDTIDRDILYSIFDKDAKRAKAYWFITVDTVDEPFTANYELDTYGTDFIYRVELNLGFKVEQSINIYIRQIVEDLLKSGELPRQNRRYSIYDDTSVDSFKFCFIKKAVPKKNRLSAIDDFIIRAKYAIRKACGSYISWYGLDTTALILESVPLMVEPGEPEQRIRRLYE